MAELLRCSIDSLHAHSVEIFCPSTDGDGQAAVAAKIGYRASGKPVGEVTVNGLEEHEEVFEAAVALVRAVEKAFSTTIGVISDDTEHSTGEPPAGLSDF
jgi:hypothetical protein